ncbi:MAG TPA: AraC family transcriptional regulator [Anaerolineales bacterium]|nr:AraC family transcriptional regulator [Anaerolineales bacterium]
MDFSTRGIQFYPEYFFQAYYRPEETFNPASGADDRLHLVLVEGGSGLLNLSGRLLDFIAPALIFINEKEIPSLEHSAALKARAILFHPSIVNSGFTFKSIREEPPGDPLVYWQDRSSLRPFLVRGDGFTGLLPLGPLSTRRAVELFDSIRHQLVDQPDNYWVCRSRSFILELLTLAEQMVMTPEHIGTTLASAPAPSPQLPEHPDLLGENSAAGHIILYLHAHYAEKITIPALTRTFHTNRTTLAEQFHRATSMPVMTYLAQLRMRQASLLLRDTVLPISEIMLRVGFQNGTHFWRTFRKHIGISPTEYRERYCWLMRPQ